MGIIKASFLFLCLLVSAHVRGSTFSLKWSATVDSVSTLSSPMAYDLNRDGIKDIVLGVGNEYDTINYVVAMDGYDGHTIWKTFVDSDIYGSALFYDINGDNTPEIFITGRNKGLFCLNGADGHIIWKFSREISPELFSFNYNFYQPKLIDNIFRNDNSKLLLISYGGNPVLPPHSTDRKTGYLLIISPHDGQILVQDTMPDGKETYANPQVFKRGGEDYFILGTGGETDGGSLWLAKISDIYGKNFSQSARRIDGPYEKGFVQPSLIIDLNGDNFPDFISINLGGTITALDGISFDKKWQLTFEGFEIYSTPTPVTINGEDGVYIVLVISKGEFEQGYQFYQTLLIDLKDGSYQILNDSGSLYQINSGVSYKSERGAHYIYSYNKTYKDEYYVDYLNILLPDNTEYSITGSLTGNNIGSTPLLQDLDNDGFAELIINYNIQDFRSPSTVKIMTYSTDIPVENIIWDRYLGESFNNIYSPPTITSGKEYNHARSVQIFPNPVHDRLYIQSSSKIYSVKIYHSSGSLVTSMQFDYQHNINLSTEDYISGTYVIILQTGQDFFVSKFIKD